ncbi:MAG: SufD family Fe-S cluster assembly protein [Thermoplasmata archaeon]|nr:SufD family Fe-S cluster assembly protein [Thermoplasmata archaeon]
MAAAAPNPLSWLTSRQVDELSESLSDPPAHARRRRKAFDEFLELPLEPNPLYRKYGYFGGVDLAGIDPISRGRAVGLPQLPDGVVRIVHDASGTRAEIPDPVRSAGVRYEEFASVLSGEGTDRVEFSPASGTSPDRLSALGEVLVNRGYRLTVPDSTKEPVRVQDLTILSRPHEAISVRRDLHVGRDSRLLMSEEVYSTDSPDHQRVTASATSLDAAAGARTAYVTVHAPDPRAIGLYQRHARAGAGTRVGWVWAGFGGFRTRARNLSVLAGQGSDIEDLQTFYGSGHQAYDSAVQMTHVGTDTHGQSITRGLFQDDSRGMSRGLVRIEKDARKTLSYLSEHAMLLSKGARSDTIPILEILCRDVKATHSSSVAPVDPEKVFYLESRGFEEAVAIRMLGEGFLGHVLARAPIGQLRDQLYPILAARWSGDEVAWKEGAFPALNRLQFAEDVPDTDWRFDAKLR